MARNLVNPGWFVYPQTPLNMEFARDSGSILPLGKLRRGDW